MIKNHVSLITKNFGKICKYHKRAGQTYEANEIVKDFSSETFYTAYPYCLALLYHAKFPILNKITLSSPQQKGLVFTINRQRCRNLIATLGLRLLKKISQKLSFPLDIEDYRIIITVINQPTGKTYEFNIRRLNELCPASFYQLYPFLASGITNTELHCPDHQGMSYLIK